MIRPSKLPMVSVLAMHGAQLVDSINPPDPTRGAVPYRNVGLPLLLSTQAESHRDPTFHRYARVDLIASFDTPQACQAAKPAAEGQLRMNPAPAVSLSQPVSVEPSNHFVWAKDVPLGWILTQWDPTSRSVVNTTAIHLMARGFVVRQVAMVGLSLFVTTFGEGNNFTHQFAWMNGSFGGGGFKDLDVRISRGVSGEKGFQSAPAAAPSGAYVTYWSGAKQTEEVRARQPLPPGPFVLAPL